MNCRGMALVTGLLLLAAVAVIAVTAAGSMTVQQHQSANFADRMRASAGADLAASWALAWLFSRADTERETGCVSPCLLPTGILGEGEITDQPEFEGPAWWRANGVPAGESPDTGESVAFVSGSSTDAIWIVQEVHFEAVEPDDDPPVHEGVGYYRILGRGAGRHPGSTVITETIVARPWGNVQPARFPPDRAMSAFCARIAEDVPCGTLSWRRRR